MNQQADHNAQRVEEITAPFAHLTDSSVMSNVFQQNLPAEWLQGRVISNCLIVDSRLKLYQKPTSWFKSTLSLAYRLTLSASDINEPSVIILYVRAFLNARSQQAWEEIETNDRGADTACYLADQDLIVWRFPTDPTMSHLARLFEESHLEAHLPWSLLPQPGQHPRTISTTVLKYRPETRCTTRVDIGSPQSAQSVSLIAKTFAGDEGESLIEQMGAFYQDQSATIAVPEPLGYTPHLKTAWLAYIDGQPLMQCLNLNTSERYVRQVAQGLATIHHSDFVGLEQVTVPILLAELNKKVQKLGRTCPPCVEQLTHLNLKMYLLARELRYQPPKVIHCDCHVEQFLVDKGRVVFLDFDGLVWGDPEQDLAEFIVALYFYGYEEAAILAIGKQLIRHYQIYARQSVDRSRLLWHATYEYINRAYRIYQQQRPQWLLDLRGCLENIGIVERIIQLDAKIS